MAARDQTEVVVSDDAPVIHERCRTHIHQAAQHHLSDCQAARNSIEQILQKLPVLREPALQYPDLLRTRFETIFTAYQDAILPAVKAFYEYVETVSGTTGHALSEAEPDQ